MQAMADSHMHTVSGTVTGCSTKNAVHVLIYEESGWKGMNHSQEKIYEPSKSGTCDVSWSMEVPSGPYALASFEDENGLQTKMYQIIHANSTATYDEIKDHHDTLENATKNETSKDKLYEMYHEFFTKMKSKTKEID